MILKKSIPLPNTCTVENLKDRGVLIKFQSGFTLKLYWDRCNCALIDNVIEVSYLNKWSKLMQPIIKTWSNLIKKYQSNPIYSYQVTALYKHFPIRLTLEDNVIGVYNYLGLKALFQVPLRDVLKVQLRDKTLYIETHNDILTGSDLNKLQALRYKTHHKNLDRRVFTDGFLIKKL